MSQEADITINGTRLTDAESETLRVAIDTLTQVWAEGISAEDNGITATLTERHLEALVGIRKLLENRPERDANRAMH